MRRVGRETRDEPAERRGVVAFLRGLHRPFREALGITLLASTVGLVANLVHPERIPFVAAREYEVLVPCPEPGGEVTVMEADAPLVSAPETFLVDARSREAHARWSLRGAVNVPFDYLDPTPDEIMEELARRTARSKAQRVVVYGDGDTPDSGEQLAKEISARGIKNVFFVRGGAPALENAGEKVGVP